MRPLESLALVAAAAAVPCALADRAAEPDRARARKVADTALRLAVRVSRIFRAKKKAR